MQSYRELIQLTSQHLQEEYAPNEWLVSTPETCQFFRNLYTKPKPPIKTPPPQKPKIQKTVRSIAKKPSLQPKPVMQEPPEKSPEPVALKPEKQEAPHDLKEQLDLIRQVCPNTQIIDSIPAPRGPKKVVILCDLDPFWEKVGGALTDRGLKVDILPIDGEISKADLVLVPRNSDRKIEGSPIIYTEKTALYQQDTYLKKVLWQSLCQQLQI